jgi:hypothetical protein
LLLLSLSLSALFAVDVVVLLVAVERSHGKKNMRGVFSVAS